MVVGGLFFATLQACGGVRSRSHFDEEVVGSEVIVEEPIDDEYQAIDWRFEDDALVVNVDSWRFCPQRTVTTIHTTQHVTRTLNNDHRLLAALSGIAMLGAGTYMLVDRDRWIERTIDEENGPNDSQARGTVVGLGSLLVAGGAGGLAVWLGQSVRQRDRSYDRGESEVRGDETGTVLCSERTGTSEEVSLFLPDGAVITPEARDDAYHFDLREFVPTFAPGTEHAAVLRVGESLTAPVALPLSVPYVDQALEHWGESQ